MNTLFRESLFTEQLAGISFIYHLLYLSQLYHYIVFNAISPTMINILRNSSVIVFYIGIEMNM